MSSTQFYPSAACESPYAVWSCTPVFYSADLQQDHKQNNKTCYTDIITTATLGLFKVHNPLEDSRD